VPEEYYTAGEMTLATYFTTGSFSEEATGSADSRSILLCDGRLIAEVLVAHGIAIRSTGGGEEIDATRLRGWLDPGSSHDQRTSL
jgi:hypothetical protein